MERRNGVSLAKGPVGIIGAVLLAGGILGLLMGSTDFAMDAPNGDVVAARSWASRATGGRGCCSRAAGCCCC